MPDKLKVCVCSEFPPPYGGIGVQASLLAHYLEQEEYGVKRLNTNLPDSYFFRMIARIRGIRGIFRMVLFPLRCVGIFCKVDIVHILSGSYLNFFLYTSSAVFFARLMKKPVILHYHGGAADAFLQRHFFWSKQILSRIDVLLVPSGFLADVFGKYGLKSIVVPNVVELHKFRFRKRVRIEPRILITRHLESDYNITCSLRTFALIAECLPEARLTIAGTGSEEEKLKSFAEQLDCSDAILFVGRVDRNGIQQLYAQHDILLNTSEVDNQPLSLIEAMACGLLVASTRVGGIPFMIESGSTGVLVERGDHTGLAKVILDLLQDQERALEIVLQAHKAVQRYSWTRVGDKIATVYGQVI